MSAATMETKYEVLDEELGEAVPHLTKRRTKADPTEAQADDVAALIEQTVQKALAMGTEKGVQLGMANVKPELEALIKRVGEAEAKVTSLGKPLCLFVKIGDAKVKKLAQRVSPLLPDLLMQADIGQNGGKWPMVMGPTGSGKTVLARQLAESKDLPFFAINCSEGMGETVFFGKETVKGFVEGPLWKVCKNGGVFLFDEFDAINDNTATSINTVLTTPVGKGVTNPFNGETAAMHKDAIFIAATNTNGKGGDGAYTGRNRLDGASLNRFALFELGYDTELERTLCADKTLLEQLWTIRVKLQEKNSKDVISTRDIADAYAQQVRGYAPEKIMQCLALRMDKANRDLFVVASKKGGK